MTNCPAGAVVTEYVNAVTEPAAPDAPVTESVTPPLLRPFEAHVRALTIGRVQKAASDALDAIVSAAQAQGVHEWAILAHVMEMASGRLDDISLHGSREILERLKTGGIYAVDCAAFKDVTRAAGLPFDHGCATEDFSAYFDAWSVKPAPDGATTPEETTP